MYYRLKIPQRTSYTYAVAGEIKAPSGDTDFIPPFHVSIPAGKTAKLVKCRFKINSGTSVTCKITKNGSDLTDYVGISVTTNVAEIDVADIALADNDAIAVVVTAVSGTPKNMSFTVFIDTV